MSVPDIVRKCEGQWRGHNFLWLDPEASPHESPSTSIVSSAINHKHFRIDYNWLIDGRVEEGSLLIGTVPDRGIAEGSWVDSWHNGDRVMSCAGSLLTDGRIQLNGSYEALPGPNWGWKILLNFKSPSSFYIMMFNITPDGIEQRAVELNYSR